MTGKKEFMGALSLRISLYLLYQLCIERSSCILDPSPALRYNSGGKNPCYKLQ